MALTDSAIKAAKPKAAQYKLHDEKGLLLIVRPTGGKLWRLKYRFQSKEQQLSLGIDAPRLLRRVDPRAVQVSFYGSAADLRGFNAKLNGSYGVSGSANFIKMEESLAGVQALLQE